jgi:hypothetical protein
MRKIGLATALFIAGAWLFIGSPRDGAAQFRAVWNVSAFAEKAEPAQPDGREPVPAMDGKASENDAPADSFDAQIRFWMAELAKEEGYEDWADAQWTRYPLGPGMHGWVILIRKDGKEIGYMIVNATSDGQLRLTEYGSGEYPLFGTETLYRALIKIGPFAAEDTPSGSPWNRWPPPDVERLYYGPLHAVWKIRLGQETVYADAKSGELLPLTEDSFSALTVRDGSLSDRKARIEARLRLPAFDPFERTNWAGGRPLEIADIDDLAEALADGKRITYAARLYGNAVLAPMAVTGYHRWSETDWFVRVELDGHRYIPFGIMTEFGRFYP